MERYLIEFVIVLAPIFGGPAPVEFVDRAIARLQKGVPCRHRLGIERRRPDLVVDLPADHRRMMAVPRRHLDRDAAREIAIALAGEGELTPSAMRRAAPVLIDAQRIGI